MERITFVQKVLIKHPTENNEFLLLIRNLNDKSRPGDYDLPGGSVKNYELHEDALKREVKEETNIDIKDIKPVIVDSRCDEESNHYFLYIGYSASTLNSIIKLNPNEHSGYVWTTLEEFKKQAKGHILIKQIEASYS